MGTFYFSITTRGPTQDELAEYLTRCGHSALVSVAINGVATIFPAKFRNGAVAGYRFNSPEAYLRGETGWEPLVSDLSAYFACPAFAVEVCDSDCLYYQLYNAGRLVDEYCRPIDYFGPFRGHVPVVLNTFLLRSGQRHAAFLCAAFGSSALIAVARWLGKITSPFCAFPAGDVHGLLIDALELPTFTGYWGIGAAYGSREADFGQGNGPAFVSTPPHWRPGWESP